MKTLNRPALAGLSSRLHHQWHASKAHGLWHAWVAELQGMLPVRWQARWVTSAREQVVPWPLTSERLVTPGPAVVLVLPPDTLLTTSLQLPAAATRRLHQVLGYELDKFTPFPAADLHYVAQVVNKGKVWAGVRLVALRRDRLQAMIDTCRQHGLVLAGIDGLSPEGQRLGVNLLPLQDRPPASRARTASLYLALLCAGLVLANMGLWLHNRQALVEAMQAQVNAQRQQVAQVQTLRRALLAQQGAAQYLSLQKAARPALASVLVDLTACLGQDTWIEQLELNEDGAVSLSGQSAKASALIGQAKGCKTLADPHFEGIIQPDENTGKDRFSLRAQLTKGVPDATAP